MYRYTGSTNYTSETSRRVCFTFDWNGSAALNVQGGTAAASSTSGNNWGLTPGAWTKVTGIVPSPNMWGGRGVPVHGKHTFFLLEGCKDTSEGIGRGFFPEMVRSELRAVRSTLEAHLATAKVDPVEAEDASGLGMSDQTPWNLTLRVQTPSGMSTYLIDRQD